MAESSEVRTKRVFSEDDVRAIVGSVVDSTGLPEASVGEDEFHGLVSRVMAEHESELRGEVVSQEVVYRVAALGAAAAVGYSAHSGLRFDWVDAIPQRVWDELHERGLVRTSGDDPSGELTTYTTTRGLGELLGYITGARGPS